MSTSSSVTQIAEAIGQTLGNANPPIRYLPYMGDNFVPPVSLVAIETVQFHEAFGNSRAPHTFTVFVILSRSSERAAIKQMEGYMSNAGANSLRAVLEADQTLGGIAEAIIVTKAGPPSSLTINGAAYISCPFEVTVHSG